VLTQFVQGFRYLWIAWLVMYLVLSVGSGLLAFHFRGMTVGGFAYFWMVTEVLNALASQAMLNCFLVLDVPSLPSVQGAAEEYRRRLTLTWVITIVIAATSALDRVFNLGPLDGLFGFLNSLYAGIATAFLVGRLDSHWMKVHRGVLVPLYAYAILQAPFSNFDSLSSYKQAAFFVVALLLKLGLAAVVSWLILSGNLLRFLDSTATHARMKSMPPPTSTESAIAPSVAVAQHVQPRTAA
jgi:hypothetical protein